jgi:hypothetical protein
VIDSTPVECGRSRPTAKRSNLAGWAGYGYCASHSRYFWGLRLHLVCTPTGLPITFALANPKVDERDVAIDLIDSEPALLTGRAGQTIIADKGYASAEFERRLAEHGVELVRPARTNEPRRHGAPQLRRPIKESPCAYSNDSSQSPPRSGTTTTATNQSSARSRPTTTEHPLDFSI